jgi:hypothetical protein
MEGWSDFFAAAVGASGALGGLLLTAVSVNITRIVSFPSLPPRVAQTLITIGGALVLASVALYPHQPMWVFGGEAIVVGGVVVSAGLWQVLLSSKFSVTDRPSPWRLATSTFLVAMAGAPTLAGGLLLALGDPAGSYIVATGVVLSYVTTLVNGWVLLIEILR